MDARDELTGWLRDAYAMERALETTLKKISQSEKHPEECRAACGKHLIETQQHARTVESLLKTLATETSTIKTGISVLVETMKDVSVAIAHDHLVKEMIASYASEHLEIACYQAIVVASEKAGLPHVADACRQIILDEKNMAETIGNMLPGIVRFYLAEGALGKAA
ncbi:MAG TPA: DUF892 family protein [Pseudomonadales bacterium]|nr:DUF892 family protein [Pseudomonadales bacterium]